MNFCQQEGTLGGAGWDQNPGAKSSISSHPLCKDWQNSAEPGCNLRSPGTRGIEEKLNWPLILEEAIDTVLRKLPASPIAAVETPHTHTLEYKAFPDTPGASFQAP